MYAAGYRWYNQKLVKTSIIAFVSYASDISLFFDDALVSDALPFQVTSVLPGVHTVRIEKKGSIPWEKTVLVNENTVTRIDQVLLIPTSFSWRTVLDDAPTIIFNPAQDHMAILGSDSGLVSFMQISDLTDSFLRSYNLSEGTVLRAGWIHDDLFLIFYADGTFQQFDLANRAVTTAPLPEALRVLVEDASFNDGLFARSSDGVLQELFFADGVWSLDPVVLPFWAGTIDYFFVTPKHWYIQKGTAVWQVSRDNPTQVLLLPVIADAQDSWRVWEDPSGKNILVFSQNDGRFALIDANHSMHFIQSEGAVTQAAFSVSADLFVFSVAGDLFMVDPSVSFTPVFVTRFSHAVDGLTWYDDPFHILVLQNQTLTLCERDGGNCTLLHTAVQHVVVASDRYTIFTQTVDAVVQALTLTFETGFFGF